MEGFPSGQREQTVNLLRKRYEGSNPSPSTMSNLNRLSHRGVEQLVARRAHNPEVVGSNPTPATSPHSSAGRAHPW